MFLFNDITQESKALSRQWQKYSSTQKMVVTAQLSVIAFLLQSAGELLPTVGYFISPLATCPVIMAVLVSRAYAFLSYLVVLILLSFMFPQEALVFGLSTGFFGLGMGNALILFRWRLSVATASAAVLTAGLLLAMGPFGFPIMGPWVQPGQLLIIAPISVFSLGYSFLWLEFWRLIVCKIAP